MFVYVWIIWLLVFPTGASIAQLIHWDKITDRLRERWEVHWDWRIEQELRDSDGLLNIAGMTRGQRDPGKMRELREEMAKRASREPGVRFWTRRRRRKLLRPWSTKIAEIERLEMYQNFPSCVDCLPYWPYIALTVVTVAWPFGFDWAAAVAMHTTIDMSPWWRQLYAAFLTIGCIPHAYRWLYAFFVRLATRE